jgi:hypothetical protein
MLSPAHLMQVLSQLPERGTGSLLKLNPPRPPVGGNNGAKKGKFKKPL